MIPLIGVTTYSRNESNRFTLPAEYIEAIRRAGGVPLLIPPGEPHWRELFRHIDGWLLSGGGDIDPASYGGISHPAIDTIDVERDRMEIELVHRALEKQVPTLGICRGCQVINVALGGTLIEHLPDVVGDMVTHRPAPGQAASHVVSVISGTRLASLTGKSEFMAASRHHQAIRDTASSLQVVARAPDGIIEAVEMPTHPWLIAVQWHPELTAANDPVQQRLFDEFVQAAAALKK